MVAWSFGIINHFSKIRIVVVHKNIKNLNFVIKLYFLYHWKALVLLFELYIEIFFFHFIAELFYFL